MIRPGAKDSPTSASTPVGANSHANDEARETSPSSVSYTSIANRIGVVASVPVNKESPFCTFTPPAAKTQDVSNSQLAKRYGCHNWCWKIAPRSIVKDVMKNIHWD